jgi:hypothetical protein
VSGEAAQEDDPKDEMQPQSANARSRKSFAVSEACAALAERVRDIMQEPGARSPGTSRTRSGGPPRIPPARCACPPAPMRSPGRPKPELQSSGSGDPAMTSGNQQAGLHRIWCPDARSFNTSMKARSAIGT